MDVFNNKYSYRLIVSLMSFVSGLFIEPEFHPDYLNPAPASFILMIMTFMIFGIFMISVMDKTIHSSIFEKWSKLGSFFSINRSSNINIYDLSVVSMIFSGLGIAVIELTSTPKLYFWELPFFAGLGAWIGLYLSRAKNSERKIRKAGH